MFDFAVVKDDEPQLNICCMPVVIEVVPMEANFVHTHASKFCLRGEPGQFVPGCAIQAVHMNKYVFYNYQALQLRPLLLSERLCGQRAERHVALEVPISKPVAAGASMAPTM